MLFVNYLSRGQLCLALYSTNYNNVVVVVSFFFHRAFFNIPFYFIYTLYFNFSNYRAWRCRSYLFYFNMRVFFFRRCLSFSICAIPTAAVCVNIIWKFGGVAVFRWEPVENWSKFEYKIINSYFIQIDKTDDNRVLRQYSPQQMFTALVLCGISTQMMTFKKQFYCWWFEIVFTANSFFLSRNLLTHDQILTLAFI